MAKRKRSESIVDREFDVVTKLWFSASEPEGSEVARGELVEVIHTEVHTTEPVPETEGPPPEPATTPCHVLADNPNSGPFWDLLALAGYTRW